MTFIDVDFLIQGIIFLFLLFCVVVFNIYYVATNAHPDDIPFGKSKITRTAIILSYSLAFLMIISVPLDVHISKEN